MPPQVSCWYQSPGGGDLQPERRCGCQCVSGLVWRVGVSRSEDHSGEGLVDTRNVQPLNVRIYIL